MMGASSRGANDCHSILDPTRQIRQPGELPWELSLHLLPFLPLLQLCLSPFETKSEKATVPAGVSLQALEHQDSTNLRVCAGP